MEKDDVIALQLTIQQASTPREFVDRLQELVILGAFSVRLEDVLPKDVQRVRDEELGTLGRIDDEEEYQDAKDLQRDQVCINGTLYQGGDGGYDAIVTSMINELEAAAAQISADRFEHEKDTFRLLAKRILHAANRTQSGGASYEAIDSLLRNEEWCILRPNSKDAQPLVVSIDVGPYMYEPADRLFDSNAQQSWAFGFRVCVEAHTAYAVCSADDPSTEWAIIDATYRTRLAMSCSMCPFSGIGTDRAARFDSGMLNITIQRFDH